MNGFEVLGTLLSVAGVAGSIFGWLFKQQLLFDVSIWVTVLGVILLARAFKLEKGET